MSNNPTSKTECRARARTARRVAQGQIINAGQTLATLFLDNVPFSNKMRVAGYWPFGDEIDSRPLMEALSTRGCVLALPAIVGKGMPLAFRTWSPGDTLEAGLHNTLQPLGTTDPVMPNLVLVPLVAFDRDGWRLGMGEGYYDKTLAALRRIHPVLAVGIAYAAQEIPEVPREAHDQRLDWIITERAAHQVMQ